MVDERSEDGYGKERKYMGRQLIETFASLLTPERLYKMRKMRHYELNR